jgi:hypothetical protein
MSLTPSQLQHRAIPGLQQKVATDRGQHILCIAGGASAAAAGLVLLLASAITLH